MTRAAPARTPRGLARRSRLVRAAQTIFERDGFLEARITDITAEASTATGSFSTYFTSKEEIFLAVVDVAPRRRSPCRRSSRTTRGVRVNCVVPGVIEAGLTARTTVEERELFPSKVPVGRMGRPEELAELVTWVASPACSFMTGATFDLSGGRAVD